MVREKAEGCWSRRFEGFGFPRLLGVRTFFFLFETEEEEYGWERLDQGVCVFWLFLLSLLSGWGIVREWFEMEIESEESVVGLLVVKTVGEEERFFGGRRESLTLGFGIETWRHGISNGEKGKGKWVGNAGSLRGKKQGGFDCIPFVPF